MPVLSSPLVVDGTARTDRTGGRHEQAPPRTRGVRGEGKPAVALRLAEDATKATKPPEAPVRHPIVTPVALASHARPQDRPRDRPPDISPPQREKTVHRSA